MSVRRCGTANDSSYRSGAKTVDMVARVKGPQITLLPWRQGSIFPLPELSRMFRSFVSTNPYQYAEKARTVLGRRVAVIKIDALQPADVTFGYRDELFRRVGPYLLACVQRGAAECVTHTVPPLDTVAVRTHRFDSLVSDKPAAAYPPCVVAHPTPVRHGLGKKSIKEH